MSSCTTRTNNMTSSTLFPVFQNGDRVKMASPDERVRRMGSTYIPDEVESLLALDRIYIVRWVASHEKLEDRQRVRLEHVDVPISSAWLERVD